MNMKKIAGKIAMILILVMLVNAYSSCTLMNAMTGSHPRWVWITGLIIDLTLLVAAGIVALIGNNDTTDQGVYLAGLSDSSFEAESAILKKTFASLPEAEITALTQTIISLPEKEYSSLTQTVNSISKAEITASMKRLNAAPEAELVASIQRINSMSKEERAELVEKIRSLHPMPKTNVALITKTTNSLH